MRATLLEIRVGSVRDYAASQNAAHTRDAWKSGIAKSTVAGAVAVSRLGLAGDEQADLVNHGGRDKAIHCYPREHYGLWSSELGEKAPAQGTLGENFELAGVTEDNVCIGDILQLGEVLVQISQPRQPCWKPAQLHRFAALDGSHFEERTDRLVFAGAPRWQPDCT